MRFGISTHLFHDERLERAHVARIAEAGFEAVELFATRSHFDYHDPAAVAALSTWLSDTGLRLDSVHAPIALAMRGGRGAQTLSTAAAEHAARQAAVREADLALQIARQIPFDFLVLHLGTPTEQGSSGSNNRLAALRSAEEICRLAEPLGVRVALEVIPNELSTPAALVSLLEGDLDAPTAGICLDFGHAHLMGEVADAVEIAAEHLIATHVHDNRRRDDLHLAPFLGTIDWDTALMTMQKIGYEGTYLMELANTGSPGSVLQDAQRARQRFERTLTYP
ncbi:MAG: sugar phosphate isomerase/epimerase [Acidobacteriota bacterium]|nr:sugar phosphate isomerase/epimerase [Acidobacteriota bacterium]